MCGEKDVSKMPSMSTTNTPHPQYHGAQTGRYTETARDVEVTESVPVGYLRLNNIFRQAFEQACYGKGKERHANDRPFVEQSICQITRDLGTAFPKGQAVKKILESKKLRTLRGVDAEIQELRGAMVYLAAAILVIEETENAHDH